MTKVNNRDFVGMKKKNGKSKNFKNLQQEVKRKQKAEEIAKAIQKIQNEPPVKRKETKQAKRKFAKVYENQEFSMNHDVMCEEEAKNDSREEIHMQQLEEMYHDHQESSSGEEYEEFPDWARRKQEEDEDMEARMMDWYYDYSAAPVVDDFVSESMSLDEEEGEEEGKEGEEEEGEGEEEEDEEEKRNQTNEAIYDYVCGNLTDDEDEVLEPIVPKHYEFESRIYDLEHKLSYAQESMYQLLGGLYNPETQRELLKSYTTFLYTGNNYLERDVSESIWPTTRQGDENEDRIKRLEENIDILVKRLKKGKPLHRFYRKFQKK